MGPRQNCGPSCNSNTRITEISVHLVSSCHRETDHRFGLQLTTYELDVLGYLLDVTAARGGTDLIGYQPVPPHFELFADSAPNKTSALARLRLVSCTPHSQQQ